MIKQEMESVGADTLTFLKGIEVRSLWEVSHAAVLTVFILHTSTQIRLESLGLSTSILCVSVREFRHFVGGQTSWDDVLWVDWVDHRWFYMVLVMARVNVFRIFVVVMRVNVLRVFLGVDVWFNVTWIVFRAWNTVGTPRMVKDLVIIIFRDAQVIIVPDLVERILHWVRLGTPRPESKFELEEACTCILIPDILVFPAAGEVVAELRIGHRSVGRYVDRLSVHWSLLDNLDLLLRSSFADWHSHRDVLYQALCDEFVGSSLPQSKPSSSAWS